MHKQTLAHARIGGSLGARVIAIIRHGKKRFAPHADDMLWENDVLIVEGRRFEIEELQKFHGIEVERPKGADIIAPDKDTCGGIITIGPTNGAGKTLRQLKFRERYDLIVVAIERNGEKVRTNCAAEVLREGDQLQVIGKISAFEGLKDSAEFPSVRFPIAAGEILQDLMFVAPLPETSIMAGATIRESRLGERVHLTIVGFIRNGAIHLMPAPDEKIERGDKLLLIGEPEQVEHLRQLGELKFESQEVASEQLESRDVGILEVVLAPRSRLLESTLSEVNFREKYDFQVLAIWREGRPLRSRLGNIKLEFGDALLIQGPRSKIPLLLKDPDFVVLTGATQAPRRKDKAFFAIFGLVLMTSLQVFELQPIHIASILGALCVVLGGAISMEEAYRDVEWRVVALVAGLLPLGVAVERSGVLALASQGVLDLGRDYGPYAMLISLSLLCSLISQALDGTLAVVLLAPVALWSATELGISPQPFLMTVALSASIAFMTPFSHRAHLLVMGAGGYKFKDYFKVGTLLSAIILVIVLLMVPLIYPF